LVCGGRWYGWIEVRVVRRFRHSFFVEVEMSLTQSITRGITSATYNPEAEKAMQEERKKATEAKQKYREGLFKIRDKKAEMIQEKKASDFFIKKADELANEGFAWLTANPDADSIQITDQSNLTAERYQDISKANLVLLGLSVLPNYYKSIASDAFLKKQINEQKKQSLDAFADSIDAWLKTSPQLTTEAIFSKQQEFQTKAKEVLEGTGATTPAVTSPSSVDAVKKEAEAKEAKVKQEEEADKNTFKLSRLVSETGRIALKVVGSLFIVMLFLVSGMLTANDAIGRDPQYRIFYFIYGGIGFPFLLFYYLYRWFSGTAPHIYRLLPLYSKPADTSLMRFLLFPFTYVEDKKAIDAKTKFMTEAAKLVGKEYKPPAEALSNTLGSLVEGLQGLALNSLTGMKKGTNIIVEGMEKLNVSK
jgi:hypothetical protein